MRPLALIASRPWAYRSTRLQKKKKKNPSPKNAGAAGGDNYGHARHRNLKQCSGRFPRDPCGVCQSASPGSWTLQQGSVLRLGHDGVTSIVTQNQTISVPLATLILAAQTPTVVNNNVIAVPVRVSRLSGKVPTIVTGTAMTLLLTTVGV